MHETTSILNDTTFWYSMAVVGFVLLFIWKVRGPVLGWMDGEIAKVHAELNEAKRLREEAAATLKEYKGRQAQALQEAEQIVEKAKEDAARLREEAVATLKADMDRHEKAVMDRIQLAKEDALKDVKAFVVETAMRDVRGKINKMRDEPETLKLVDTIISDLPKLKKAKGG